MTETLPPNVSTFTVVGRLVKGVADSDDVDQDVDILPIVGANITFTPSLTPPIYKVMSATPSPITVYQESVRATTDENGYVKVEDNLSQGVELVYGFDPDILPNGWTWSVMINVGGNFPPQVFAIQGSDGGIVDLSTVMPVPPNPGEDVIYWQSVLDEINEVKAGIEDGTYFVDAIETVPAVQASLDKYYAHLNDLGVLVIDDVAVGGVGGGGWTPVDATTTVKGIVELATSAETTTGTDAVRATTPAGVKAAILANATALPVASATVQGIVELATDAETVSGVDATRAATPASVKAALTAFVPPAAVDATVTTKGIVELATDTEAVTGTDTVRAVTPANVKAVFTSTIASDTAKGVVELATDAEAVTGTDATRATTPASVKAAIDGRVASTTVKGIVELATSAEVLTGTDTTRAVTPSGVKAAMDAGGFGGFGGSVAIHYWDNATASYPVLPVEAPPGLVWVIFEGPQGPNAENVVGGIPSWIGTGPSYVRGSYEYGVIV